MLNINNQVISMNRGDCVSFTVSLTDENAQPYTREPGDSLLFCVRAEPDESSPVLLRVESATDTIYLNAQDTRGLPVGRYSAALRLQRAGGQSLIVYPVLKNHGRLSPWNNFILDPEVSL